jgi:hypothetical protein
VLECEWTEYSDIDINTRSYREGVDVYFLTSVRISPWFVYEIDIKWSLERDTLTHIEISTHTWTPVVNVVKGSYTLRKRLVENLEVWHPNKVRRRNYPHTQQ